jgi:hypothetical protein
MKNYNYISIAVEAINDLYPQETEDVVVIQSPYTRRQLLENKFEMFKYLFKFKKLPFLFIQKTNDKIFYIIPDDRSQINGLIELLANISNHICLKDESAKNDPFYRQTRYEVIYNRIKSQYINIIDKLEIEKNGYFNE